MQSIIDNALTNQKKLSDIEIGMETQARIRVVGCGGAGNNTANWLYKKGIKGAEVIAINTDQQQLAVTEADHKILIGRQLTRGLGAGGNPNVGKEAANETMPELKEALKGTDLMFVLAGLGGGTGTGSAPIVAKVGHDNGAIVISVVTMPFKIERARIDKAEKGLYELRKESDSVIVIDNDRLIEIVGGLPVAQAFAVANEIVSTMIKSIVETIALPSLVNLDFADVKTIMKAGSLCTISLGESDSDKRVEEAVKRAMNNPLLEVDYTGATGALIHFTGGEDMTLEQVNRAGELITQSLDENALVMWGARVQPDMNGKLRIMLIATGVKSPYILGPKDDDAEINNVQTQSLADELGIHVLK